MKKVIVFNILILLLIFCASEAYFFNRFFKETKNEPFQNPYYVTIPDILQSVSDSAYYPRRYIEPPERNYMKEKAPILLLGCSYAFGTYLTSENNLAGQLKKLTNRWVYNWGIAGHDTATALMLLDEEVRNPVLKRKPEYIIYIYVFHHLQRNTEKKYYRYYRKKGFIENQKHNFLDNFWTYSYFRNRKLEDLFWNDWELEAHRRLFFTLISNAKKITDKLYPESKFIILIYNDVNYDQPEGTLENMGHNEYKLQKLFDIMEDENFKKELEQKGFTVITTESLIGRKMDRPEDRIYPDSNRPHPTAGVWQEIAPKLVEKIGL